MGEFKINYYLQKIQKEKTYHFILVSVSWNNKRIRTTLKINIDEKLWDNNKQRAKATTKNPREINDKLDEIRTKLKIFYDETLKEFKRVPSVKEAKAALDAIIHNRDFKSPHKNKKKEKTFMDAFNDFIEDTKSGIRLSSNGKRIQPSTITSYVTTQNHLNDFLKGMKNELTFNDIDDAFFSSLTKFLSKLGLSNNSQGRFNKVIKSMMHYTFDKGLHNNRKFIKALKVFDEPTNKIALNQDELIAVEQLEGLSDRLQKIKDLFLVQIYTGLRFSDLYNLKPANINHQEKTILIFTIKTQDPLLLPLTSKLDAILSKYNCILPKISSQKYNVAVKEVGKLAGITTPVQVTTYIGKKRTDEMKPKYELISSHTARRTFITISLTRNVVPEFIMKSSGHSSRRSFERYIRITEHEALKEMRKAWED